MASPDLSIEELQKMVEEREAFLSEMFRYVSSHAKELGIHSDHQTHSCHFQDRYTLKGFHGFTFEYYGALTMYGGYYVKVSKDGHGLVCDYTEYSDNTTKLAAFSETAEWQEEIKAMMANPQKYRDEYKDSLDEARRQRLEAEEKVRQEDALRKRARELKITP